MILVKTTLQHSSIHGFGCFAAEPIKEGQLVWRYDARVDVRFSPNEIHDLPIHIQELLTFYGYRELADGREVITLCGDHSRHMNHSVTPNLTEAGPNKEFNIAARDIDAGEELTCNYHNFDLGWIEKPGFSHSPAYSNQQAAA